jgi:hypothetical protein
MAYVAGVHYHCGKLAYVVVGDGDGDGGGGGGGGDRLVG